MCQSESEIASSYNEALHTVFANRCFYVFSNTFDLLISIALWQIEMILIRYFSFAVRIFPTERANAGKCGKVRAGGHQLS